MQRAFSVLIILGLIMWGFLLWERAQPVAQVERVVGQVDNANTADRCAQYKMPAGEDSSTWSLGYEGRIRQFLHGCF